MNHGHRAYHGEVWTDGRGYATVKVPAGAERLAPPLEYQLCELDPHGDARITAELRDGQFTLRTNEPHVKVAWRISGRAVRPSNRVEEGESDA